MIVQINGKDQKLVSGTTITELLDKLKLTPATVVIEVNQTIMSAEKYSDYCLQEDDKVELIRFVGGGS